MSGDVHVQFCESLGGRFPWATLLVCTFVLKSDAERFYEELPKRLALFGLEVVPEKTNNLLFHRKSKQGFEFLGFEFYWGKGRKGLPVLKRRTYPRKLKAALASFTDWSRKHGHLRKNVLFAKLNLKLRGYWNYYGIRGNSKGMHSYFYSIKGILFKWLNRRSQRKSYAWIGFNALLKDFHLVKPCICHDF